MLRHVRWRMSSACPWGRPPPPADDEDGLMEVVVLLLTAAVAPEIELSGGGAVGIFEGVYSNSKGL